MENNILIVERLLYSPTREVWAALTDVNELRSWYFNLEEFKAEVGFQFQFWGGPEDGVQYLHVCEVTEVVAEKKLAYSWRYDGYPGNSTVTFELFDQGDKTLLKLTHSGLDTFDKNNASFAVRNFEEGWKGIIGHSLPQYLRSKHFQHQMAIGATKEKIFESLTTAIPLWWTKMFEGTSNQVGEQFTVRFGASIFKTICVEELVPGEKVVWRVTDVLIDVPGLQNKSEWLNTLIIWEIVPRDKKAELRLTHVGLHSAIECYEICTAGWKQFTESLISYIETGIGTPLKAG